jgi:hypothetical protein
MGEILDKKIEYGPKRRDDSKKKYLWRLIKIMKMFRGAQLQPESRN